MNRRDFLRRASLVAAGAVAADQFELLDRLGWVRRFFPGFGTPKYPRWDASVTASGPLTEEMLRECLRRIYERDAHYIIPQISPVKTPFVARPFGAPAYRGIEVVRG